MFKRLKKLARSWFIDKNCRVLYTFVFSNVMLGIVVVLSLAQVELPTPMELALMSLFFIGGFAVCVTLTALVVPCVHKHLVKVGESIFN